MWPLVNKSGRLLHSESKALGRAQDALKEDSAIGLGKALSEANLAEIKIMMRQGSGYGFELSGKQEEMRSRNIREMMRLSDVLEGM